ncbi:MAG: S-methyl-5'-thioadenosine phosphorylase [Nitrospiraceae bacterium]|nr:S-methyl-5'-thioadenosine phosphorylase [Nitrospiraceae bacterium]
MSIALISGSGLYEIEGLKVESEASVATPYGTPSAPYKKGIIDNTSLVFLPRHGTAHSIPPHKVNYRANIWGLKSLGIDRIIAVTAVGSIDPDIKPSSILIPDQIIDTTYGARESTFYDSGKVVHVDFTDPYCSEMRAHLISAAEKSDINIYDSGTYICVNGPRLETAMEIEFFRRIGADVVGMTAMPEAVLARELEICYCGICIVTNFAAGITKERLTTSEVIETMRSSTDKVRKLIKTVIGQIPGQRTCGCKDALKDSSL